MRKLKLAIIAVILVAMPIIGTGQETLDLRWSWDPPTTGSQVEHYVVAYDIGDGWVTYDVTTTDPFIILPMQVGVTYTVRVAAVDAAARQGPWSASGQGVDNGPPGAPGGVVCEGCTP